MLRVTRFAARLNRALRTCVLLALVGGCLGDPLGPRGRVTVQLLPASDTLRHGAPGRPLAQPVKLRAYDATTSWPVAGAQVGWTLAGTGAYLDHASTVTAVDGSLEAVWVLGTRASEAQRLRVDVSLSGQHSVAQLRAVAVPVEVAAVKLPVPLPMVVGASRSLQAYATDPFGNRFVPQGLRFASLDTSVVSVDTLGTLRAVGGGFGRVEVAVSGFADTIGVRVVASLQAIRVDRDTLRFQSLAAVDTLTATGIDLQGAPVPGLLPIAALQDSTLARVGVGGPITVTSVQNGTTQLLLTGGGVTRAVVVQIQQVPATVQATPAYRDPIFAAAAGTLVPLACSVLDGNGRPMAIDPIVTRSATGAVAGTHCSDVRVQRSGLDTVRLAAGSAVGVVPVAVALPPVVTGASLGDLIDVSRLLAGEPWAPSARINSRGQLEVYVAWGVTDTLTGLVHEDLRRLVSADNGVTFADDGIVLQHDPTECSLTGYGFENMFIVPRQEEPGWRMFVAGGQFSCYGWQVFSAVSSDEKTWTLEPGVRVDNGAPPSSNGRAPDPYWPTGEGITIDQLPSGRWRMLMGAYEHLDPTNGEFEIMEWDSPDQLTWTFDHTVFSTRQMPPAGAGAVYSPTIRQVAPGLWRMIFTGDNRSGTEQLGPSSRLFSAVSTDMENWQLEGQLIGSDASNVYYANLAGNRLVFIRQDGNGPWRLAIATVEMP